MTSPAPESPRQSPLPLIAVATAVAGMVASRSVIGKVAMAAAAGAAAYRWANPRKGPANVQSTDDAHFAPPSPPLAFIDPTPVVEPEAPVEAPLPTQAAMAPIFPPAPEFTPAVQEQLAARRLSVELAAPIDNALEADPEAAFDDAQADIQDAASDVAATFEEDDSLVFEGDPIMQSSPPAVTEVMIDEPVSFTAAEQITAEEIPQASESAVLLETPAEAIFEQPQWVLSMEPLPPVTEAQTAEIHAALFESDVFARNREPEAPAPAAAPADSQPVAEAPILSSAHMAELLSALSKKIPALTQEPTPVAAMAEPATAAPIEDEVAAELTPEPAATFEANPVATFEAPLAATLAPQLDSITVPPATEVPVSVAALFAKLAPRAEQIAPVATQPEQPSAPPQPEPIMTSSSGPVRPKNRAMITVPSPSNPLRKNWLTWWK